jgi:germination protein M
MKRVVAVLLALSVLLGGCGVTQSQTGDEAQVQFYYAVRDTEQLTGALAVRDESRNLRAYTLSELLESYFQGPTSEDLVSPFPEGTKVLSAMETDQGLKLTMSEAFFTLQGVDMSVATCCLTQTVCAFSGATQLSLVDEMGQIQLDLSPEQFLLENSFNVETETAFTLYFAQDDHRYLVPEIREATLSDNESQETYVLRQLMEGPQTEDLMPVIPEGTELLWLTTEDGVCTVNFSQEFYANRPEDPYEAYTTLFGVVNTLTELEGVNSVQILIAGGVVDSYGIFQLSQPLSRYSAAIGPTRTSSIDLNLHVLTLTGEEPVLLPYQVSQSSSVPLAEAVAQATIDFTPPQGFYNPIPYGTELLSISVSGGVCYIDLSGKFVPADGTTLSERAAVWALVSTLTELDNISSVLLTIEGESSGFTSVDISEPLTEESVQLN